MSENEINEKTLEELEDEVLENLAGGAIKCGGLNIDKKALVKALKKGAKIAGYGAGAVGLVALGVGLDRLYVNRDDIVDYITKKVDTTVTEHNAKKYEDVANDWNKRTENLSDNLDYLTNNK